MRTNKKNLETSKVSDYVAVYKYDDITRRTKCLTLLNYLDFKYLKIFNYSDGDKLASLEKFGRPDNAIYYNMDSAQFKLVTVTLVEDDKYSYTVIKDLPTYADLFNEVKDNLTLKQKTELESKFKYNCKVNEEEQVYLDYSIEQKPHKYNVVWSAEEELLYDIYFQLPKRQTIVRLEGNEDELSLKCNEDEVQLEAQNSHPLLKSILEYVIKNKKDLLTLEKLENGYVYKNTYFEDVDDIVDYLTEEDE